MKPPDPSPPGLNGAMGGAAALLKAAMRSRKALGFSDTGGGPAGLGDAGVATAGGGDATGEASAGRGTGCGWAGACAGAAGLGAGGSGRGAGAAGAADVVWVGEGARGDAGASS